MIRMIGESGKSGSAYKPLLSTHPLDSLMRSFFDQAKPRTRGEVVWARVLEANRSLYARARRGSRTPPRSGTPTRARTTRPRPVAEHAAVRRRIVNQRLAVRIVATSVAMMSVPDQRATIRQPLPLPK